MEISMNEDTGDFVSGQVRERKAISRYLVVRAARAMHRHNETTRFAFLERMKLRWCAMAYAVAAAEIEGGEQHNEQSAWVRDIGGCEAIRAATQPSGDQQ
jgi:hypothetical protein